MATAEVESVPTTLPAAETQEVLTNTTEEIKQTITQEEAAEVAAADPVVDEPTEGAEPADAPEAEVVVEEGDEVELTEETKDDENPEEEKKPEDLEPVVVDVAAATEEKPVDHEKEEIPAVAEEPSTEVSVEKID